MSAQLADADTPKFQRMSQFALMALQGQIQRFAQSGDWGPDDLEKIKAVRLMVEEEWLSGEEAAGDAG